MTATVVRGDFEASYVFYGAIGLIIAAFLLAAAVKGLRWAPGRRFGSPSCG